MLSFMTDFIFFNDKNGTPTCVLLEYGHCSLVFRALL